MKQKNNSILANIFHCMVFDVIFMGLVQGIYNSCIEIYYMHADKFKELYEEEITRLRRGK